MQWVWNFTKKWLKRILYSALTLCLVKTVWIWAFRVDGKDALMGLDSADLFARRSYLLHNVVTHSSGPDAMPSALPPMFQGEWALVTSSMTAMALTNMAYLYPKTKTEACAALDILIKRVLKKQFRAFDHIKWGRDPLDTLQKTDGHIGYLGHLNLILAARAALGPKPFADGWFHRISEGLVHKLTAKEGLHAETYPGERYIPDHAVVIASLALYDKIFPGRATHTAKKWLLHAQQKLRDPKTGLFVFQLDSKGKPAQQSRGSGSAWNLFYLFYADPSFAKNQYARMKKQLYQCVWGVCGMREWAGTNEHSGDVDSGPLLFGLSPAATGFAIAGARYTRDPALLGELLFTSELAGFSWQWGGKRSYLLAPMVGEASMLAMRTVTPWKLSPRHVLPPQKNVPK